MGSIVEMCFNPYSCMTQIQINGRAVSEYSSLIQFMTEPLYLWCDQLFDLLYNEINDRFSLIFTGRDFDADILNYLAKKNENCISFRHKPFVTDIPFQKRMILLNEEVKKSKVDVARRRIDVDFVLSDEKYRRFTDALEVGNRFCYIEKKVFSIQEYNRSELKSRYMILLCDDFDIAERIYSETKCGFVLKETGTKSFVSFDRNFCYLETKENDDLFESIFDCLLYGPLCDAFVDCISSLGNDQSVIYSEGFRILTAIKPLVKVDLPDEVEVGRSVDLKIYTEPPTEECPEIVFEYDRSGIVKCTNQRIEGLKPGDVNILLYEKGSSQAFDLKHVRAIKRNRIKDLMLSDTDLTLGVGDVQRLNVHYFPEDADNADKIEWLSTDTSVVTVSSGGMLRAESIGRCQIICSAENASVRTYVEVKPYLKDLVIDHISEDEVLIASLDQDMELVITPTPEDAIDRDYQIRSSDIMIVNIYGRTIHPVSIGEAEILINNCTNRIQKSIKIKVVKKAHGSTSKKKGFWRLFK